MIDAFCTNSSLVNFGVTGPNLTEFLHNLETLWPFNLQKSKLRFCNQFWNAIVPNEGEFGQFQKFCHKIGCHGNAPLGIAK